MKKLLTLVAGIFTAMMLTSCLTLSTASETEDKVEKTADNSAIIIIDTYNSNSYQVMQNDYEVDDYGFLAWKQTKITHHHIIQVMDPVLVGSKIKIFSHTYVYSTGQTVVTSSTYYGIAGGFTVDKPGIMFICSEKNPEKYELKALKKIAPKYKKTVYNEAIQKRIAELKNKDVSEGDDDE